MILTLISRLRGYLNSAQRRGKRNERLFTPPNCFEKWNYDHSNDEEKSPPSTGERRMLQIFFQGTRSYTYIYLQRQITYVHTYKLSVFRLGTQCVFVEANIYSRLGHFIVGSMTVFRIYTCVYRSSIVVLSTGHRSQFTFDQLFGVRIDNIRRIRIGKKRKKHPSFR